MYLDLLTVALKNKYDTEYRSGIHISDLTLCPRKSVFRRVEPQALTLKELNFFTSGRAIHDVIQTLCKSNENRFEIEKEIEHKGITGHVDLYDRENNIPIECKSYRTKELKEPKPFHVNQLKNYMAVLNAPKGVILYQLLMNFDNKPFVEFEVTMTDKERKATLRKLENLAENMSNALEQKNPAKAVHVMNDKDLNFQCNSCPYYQQCKEINESE